MSESFYTLLERDSGPFGSTVNTLFLGPKSFAVQVDSDLQCGNRENMKSRLRHLQRFRNSNCHK